MSTGYAEADELDINDPIVMDDLSDQITSSVMEPFSRVPFTIKSAKVRTQETEGGDWGVKRLVIDAVIDAAGVDGEGKYANKHQFPELVLTFNREIYNSEWWMKSSRGPTKQFFAALGYDPAKLPNITADLLAELVGRQFVADIKRKPIQEKTGNMKPNGKPEYINTGEFKNELANYREAEN